MSRLTGKAGKWELNWRDPPRGASGIAQLELAGSEETVDVRWRRDSTGIWIELPQGTYGFDILAERDDDGRASYSVSRRMAEGRWSGVSFARVGDESVALAAGMARKGVRVRAQMPGKILRIMVKSGQLIEKGQPLLVMEAMKMENEIRAAQAGKVSQVKVAEGQAVETGADLCVIDPA